MLAASPRAFNVSLKRKRLWVLVVALVMLWVLMLWFGLAAMGIHALVLRPVPNGLNRGRVAVIIHQLTLNLARLSIGSGDRCRQQISR